MDNISQQRNQTLVKTAVELPVYQGEQRRREDSVHENDELIKVLNEIADNYVTLENENAYLEDTNHTLSEEIIMMKELGMDSSQFVLPGSTYSEVDIYLDRIKVSVVSKHWGLKFFMYVKILYNENETNDNNCIFEHTSKAIESINGSGEW